jgi:hypothetical protein
MIVQISHRLGRTDVLASRMRSDDIIRMTELLCIQVLISKINILITFE